MADISKCSGLNCPLKESCYRYTAPSSDFGQSYLFFVPFDKETNNCDFYYDKNNIENSNVLDDLLSQITPEEQKAHDIKMQELMKNNKPILESAIFEFTQEGNCLSKGDEFESLKVEFNSSLGLDRDGDGFFILKTKGWSIDSAQDLEELFNRIKKVLNDELPSD